MEMINGYPCRNCSDVELAKKYINPDKPDDGPFGRDSDASKAKRAEEKAVLFGGSLAGLDTSSRISPVSNAVAAQSFDTARPRVDFSV